MVILTNSITCMWVMYFRLVEADVVDIADGKKIAHHPVKALNYVQKWFHVAQLASEYKQHTGNWSGSFTGGFTYNLSGNFTGNVTGIFL